MSVRSIPLADDSRSLHLYDASLSAKRPYYSHPSLNGDSPATTRRSTPATYASTTVPLMSSKTVVRSEWVLKFRARSSFTIGVILIVFGTLSVIASVVAMVFQNSFSLDSIGILCGFLYSVTGGIGIWAASHRTKCRIIAFLILCALSVAWAILQVVFGMFASIRSQSYCNYLTFSFNFQTYSSNNNCINTPTAIAMEAMQAIIGTTIFIIAFWGFFLCVAVLCCFKPGTIEPEGCSSCCYVRSNDRNSNLPRSFYSTTNVSEERSRNKPRKTSQSPPAMELSPTSAAGFSVSSGYMYNQNQKTNGNGNTAAMNAEDRRV